MKNWKIWFVATILLTLLSVSWLMFWTSVVRLAQNMDVRKVFDDKKRQWQCKDCLGICETLGVKDCKDRCADYCD